MSWQQYLSLGRKVARIPRQRRVKEFTQPFRNIKWSTNHKNQASQVQLDCSRIRCPYDSAAYLLVSDKVATAKGARYGRGTNCLSHCTISLVPLTSTQFYCDRRDMKWPSERARSRPVCSPARGCAEGQNCIYRAEAHYMNQKDICQCVIYFPRSLLHFETDKSDPMPHNDNCNEAFGDIVTWVFPGNTAAFIISRYIPRRNTLSSLG